MELFAASKVTLVEMGELKKAGLLPNDVPELDVYMRLKQKNFASMRALKKNFD